MTLDELDKLAAEKVMGWHHDDVYWKDSDNDYVKRAESIATWQPTRNISQAWEVWMKVPDGKSIEIVNVSLNQICNLKINNDRYLGDTTCYTVSKSGFTTPEAIVRACLKAKGVDV